MDIYIANVSSWLQKQQTYTLKLITILFVIIIWALDYVTGPYLSTSLFYLIPVSWAAWWFKKRTALFVSFVCAGVWLLTDISTNPVTPNALIPYWNALVRLGFFSIVTLTLSSLHGVQQQQEEMLAFIVHDLRSPLGNILMSLAFVKESGFIEPPMARMLDTTISSSQKMLIQVNSLLDLAQLEKQKLHIETADFAVATLLQQAVDQVASLAEVKRIELAIQHTLDHTLIVADESLSVRVLVNLLSNAIKFSPETASICVAVERIHQDVCIRVQDQGMGIPANWQKRIFDKYEQVQRDKMGMVTGSGLGLAFCKLALEAQNGRIWVESPANGSGTIISFTLPLSTSNVCTQL